MFEVQILIPQYDNEGSVFAPVVHEQFETKALDLFGGFTQLPEFAHGQWRDEAGRLYRDRTSLYAIAVRSIVDGVHVGVLVTFAKDLYRQEAISIRYLGVFEIL